MFAVVWLAPFMVALAQDTARPSVLELSRVYQAVRAQNQRAIAARALADAASARVAGAGRPPDPQLQLGFMNYTLPGLAPMDASGMTQLQLMQMIPTAGKLRLAGRAASAQAGAAAERARDVEWDARNQAAMAFYDLYATDRALDVSRGTLRLLDDTRAVAEAMYRVGEGRQADVLRAQVEIARMAEDTLRMTTMRTAMVARLASLIDRDTTVVVGSPALPSFPDSIPLLSDLLALATERPMLRAGERDMDAAAAEARLAARDVWPDLTIGAQYGERGTERMGSLMIGASIPVFASSRQLRMRDETAAMQRMAEADLAAMRAETRADVTTAYANLARARRLASLYHTSVVPQAEAAAASALAAYRVGGVDFMTLLDDRMTVNRYRQEEYVLLADEGKAWAELEMLLGRELLDPTTVASAGGANHD